MLMLYIIMHKKLSIFLNVLYYVYLNIIKIYISVLT